MSTPQDPGAGAVANAEALKDLARDLGVGIERQIEFNRLARERAEIEGNVLEISKQNLELADGYLKKIEQQAAKMVEMQAIDDAQIDNLNQYINQLDQVAPKRAAELKILIQQADAQRAILESTTATEEERAAALLEISSLMANISKESEKISATTQDSARQAGQMTNNVSGLARNMALTADFSQTTSGNIFKMVTDLTTGDPAENFKNLGLAIFNIIRPLNLVANLIDGLFKAAVALDATSKKFQSSTGIIGNFDSTLQAAMTNTAAFGVTMDDLGSGLSALQANFSGFDPANQAFNQRAVESIATLGKFGLSAEMATKSLDFFVRVQNMSGDEALAMTRKLATSGTQIGISTTQMMSNFQSVQGTMVEFGNRSTEVFIELQAQAKATGLSLTQLVAIAEQFDTFDKAAQSTAKLNAVLGTNLSAVQMLNMEHGDRIDMLRQEITAQVGNFNTLDRYTKKLIANQLGVKSVDEAQRLLNMSTAEFTEHEAGMNAMADTQQRLQDIAKQLVPVTQAFAVALQEAINQDPQLIEDLNAAMKSLAEFSVFAADALGFLVRNIEITLAVIGALTVAKMVYLPILQGVIVGFVNAALGAVKLGTAGKASAPGIVGLGKALGSAGAAATKGALGFLAIGGALALIGAGVALAVPPLVELFSLVFDNFDKLVQIGVGWAALSSTFALLGVVAAAAGLPISTLFYTTQNWVEAMSNLNLSTLAEDLSKIGAAYQDIQGAAILLATSEGGSTSIFAGNSDVINNVAGSNINVQVDVPDINLAKVEVTLNIDGTLLDERIIEIVNAKLNVQ